jgi:Sugar-transfer associated ATP-grasp
VLSLRKYTKTLSYTLESLSQQGAAAIDDHGVSLPRQLVELVLLRMGRGKLRADDYYRLRLYRDDKSLSDKRTYASNAALPRDIFGRWTIVADDKLLTYSVLSDAGIAIPKIHAICHGFRRYRDRPTLKTVPEVAAFLRSSGSFPMIGKPILGIYSRGVYLLGRFDASADKVILEGEAAQTVEQLSARFLSADSGYLFQELLQPHQEIRQFIGNRLCTLRVIVLLEAGSSRLFMAIWKINFGDNVADNYWREGNLLAELDQECGEILQCMTGLGPKHRTVDRHPRTGKLLAGFRVPRYRDAIDLALQASKSFPGVPMQAWDIAITDDGPIPLELNVAGNLFIPQLVSRKGLWCGQFDDYFRSLCKRNSSRLPGSPQRLPESKAS